MAWPTQWTWVWLDSGSWWWTGRPGVLRFMGWQRIGHDRATEMNWSIAWSFWWPAPIQEPTKSCLIRIKDAPSALITKEFKRVLESLSGTKTVIRTKVFLEFLLLKKLQEFLGALCQQLGTEIMCIYICSFFPLLSHTHLHLENTHFLSGWANPEIYSVIGWLSVLFNWLRCGSIWPRNHLFLQTPNPIILFNHLNNSILHKYLVTWGHNHDLLSNS